MTTNTGSGPGQENLGSDFWVYRTGRTVSSFGDALGFIAFSQWILNVTGSAAAMAAIVAPASVIRLFILPILGPVGDRVSRKKLILIGDATQTLVWTLMFLFLLNGDFSIKLFTAFYILSAVGQGLFSAGDTAILPHLVPKESLSSAVKQKAALQSITSVASGALAGAAVAFLGTKQAFLMNAASFFLALCFTALIRSDTSPQPAGAGAISARQWAGDIWEGITFIRDTRIFLWVALFSVIINLAAVPLYSMLAVYVKVFDLSGAGLLGLMQSASGLGAVAASLYLKRSKSRHSNAAVLHSGLLIFGAAAGLMCISRIWQLSLAGAFLVGVSGVLVSLPVTMQVAHTVPSRMRSRFGTLLVFMCGLSAPMGLYLAGLVSDRFGIRWVLASIGIWVTLCSPLMYLMPAFMKWLQGESALESQKVRAG